MKKLVSILFTLALFFGVTTHVFAADKQTKQDDSQTILDQVNKANSEIQKLITQAQDKAQLLKEQYLNDITAMEQSKGNVKLEDEKAKVLEELNKAKNGPKVDLRKVEKAQQKVQEVNAKIEATHYNINEQYARRTAKYNRDLNHIIIDLKHKTKAISQNMIKKAAQQGVLLKKSWVKVQIGNRVVWIDPIRVVGGY